MRRYLLIAALAALAGCGGETPAPPRAGATATVTAAATPARPALCGKLNVRVLGTATGPAELSGLVRSPDGGFWTHNDSGDGPRLFHLSRTGAVTGEVTLQGATAVDWEDIAIRGHTLYVGDIGDNTAQRPEIAVYRVREGTTAATKITLHYPDRAHDAEALLVDPRNGALTIVAKDYGGVGDVYTGRSGTLRHAGALNLGLGQPVTGGDVSADGRTIVLRTYSTAFVWTRRDGESIPSALKRAPCTAGADLLAEGQGEALALARDGRSFYTVPEGANPPLRRYGG